MKNKEKFAKEIFDLAIHGNSIALRKSDNCLCACGTMTNCRNCSFWKLDGGCSEKLYEWAESEYVEPKEFIEEEKELMRICSYVKYVARDKNGMVWGYNCKPRKSRDSWIVPDDWQHSVYVFNISELTCLLFESVKFEDDEPTSREEILG